ncbi:MAG: sugar ABC transporter ATP-binding protein [Pirellulaceae bacterium]
MSQSTGREARTASSSALLSVHGVGKSFGPTIALSDVSFDLAAGESLAIIGENGAGKSTLMKVLSGVHRPDRGRMELLGEPFEPRAPADGLRRGVAMIYQELSLAPEMSVVDNILLGQERSRWGFLRRSEQRRIARDALASLGHADLDLNRPVGSLPMGWQQLVEIARCLAAEARVLIFDEPTSSLTKQDTERLFLAIDTLRKRGVAILYISHFLEEVRRVTDRYLILRDGAQVASGELDGIDDPGIIRAMVGRDIDDFFPTVEHQRGEPLVSLSGLSGVNKPHEVDLTLHRGEIVGVAGLVGAGRTELLRCLYGLDQVRSGEIRIAAEPVAGRSARSRVRQGFGMVSEDRKTEGLAQELSILENCTMSYLRPFAKWGWLRAGQRRVAADRLAREFHVKAYSVKQPVSELSGGNQQKVALARLANQEAEIFLLDEPTRGIDVGTKAEIYRWMGQWVAEGKVVLVVSSYLPELMAVCDRIAVMARGRVLEVRPTEQWSEHELMELAISSS